MAGSDYSLRLRATLDTTQVQQELKKLRAAQAMVLEQGGGVNKGLAGTAHVQKIEVQLTKLNSAISGLQRAVEQLARGQISTPKMQGDTIARGGGYLPGSTRGRGISSSAVTNAWMGSNEFRRMTDLASRAIQANVQRFGGNLPREYQALQMGGIMAHNVMKSGALARYLPIMTPENYANKINMWGAQHDIGRNPAIRNNELMASMRQNKQIATIIGGQVLGGAGELATGLGYNRTGAVLGGIGHGVTAGGSMAFGASLMGAGAAAGPIGLVVGLGAAALAVTKSLNEMNEAARQAAENQRKVAEALRQTSISQSLERYGTWQGIRAEQVRKENNLPVAKERAAYFKNELTKAQGLFFAVQDPKEYEERIRREAEVKKNSTVTERRAVSGGGTATGVYSVSIEEYQRERTEEEKAEIDKAANEAIQAHQKKFEAAKKEYQAVVQNAKTWEEVADALQKQKDAADKMSRETRNQEFAKRRQLREGALVASEAYVQSDRIRSTQIMAMDILNNKQSGPLEKFNQIAEELDRLRADRKSLVEQAYGINKDIAKGGRDSNELADMTKRRDQLLKDAGFLAERAGILESALGSISTSVMTPDISHLTSLAQYGFNMGEKDDSVERMDKYYSKSLNLQQQIKDKLDEGIKTEAIYN